jgi:hypothetical protein
MISLSLSLCWLCPGVDEVSGPHVTDNPNRCGCGCSNLVSLARILQGGRHPSEIEKRLMAEIESGYAGLISGTGPVPVATFENRTE